MWEPHVGEERPSLPPLGRRRGRGLYDFNLDNYYTPAREHENKNVSDLSFSSGHQVAEL